ncbi:MAG: GAF domain-containing protein [Chloroflexi bacterium]|nr:MAG: GAF domain-containing protein [Chloroflexota bacterium]
MSTKDKSKAELLEEITRLQQQIDHLEEFAARCQQMQAALRHQISLEDMVTALATEFISVPNSQIDAAIQHALQKIGEFAGVDRSYLFLFSPNGLTMTNTHEWCAAGIAPQIDRLQNLPVADFPWWMEKLGSTDCIHISQVDALPPEAAAEKEILQAQGIRSAVVVPMALKGKLIGFLGFDSVRAATLWSNQDIRLLQLIGATICSVLARQQAEENLRRSEEKWRALVQYAPEIVATLARDGTILFINRTVSGRSVEQVAGKSIFKYLSANQHAKVREGLRLAFDHQQTYKYETSNQRTDGRTVWLSNSMAPIKHNGQVVAAILIATDITDLKETEVARETILVAEREQRLLAETLREVTLSLTAQTTHEAVLDEILKQAQRIVPYRMANIMLLEGDTLRVAREQVTGLTVNSKPIAPNPSLNLPLTSFTLEADVVHNQTPVVLADVKNEPRWVMLEHTTWIRSHIAIPICHRDNVLGILQLDSEVPGQYTWKDVEYLKPLTSAAAIALENARLYEQTRIDAETKALLLQEVNHRVANNLTAISGMLSVERNHLKEADLQAYQAIMHDLTNRVNGLATVHNMLSATEWAPIPLDEMIMGVIQSSLQMIPFSKNVDVTVSATPVRVTSDLAHNLALIINELATNTTKYALNHRDAAAISVKIQDFANQQVQIEFRDDGPGYPEDVLRMERFSVGLELVNNMTRRTLRGNWQLFNDSGAVTVIVFQAGPLPKRTTPHPFGKNKNTPGGVFLKDSDLVL